MSNFKNLVNKIVGASCRSYSGRNMYGKSCLGVGWDGDLAIFIADFMRAMKDSNLSNADKEDIIDEFESMRTDSLGRGMIIYFPTVDFVDEDGDDDE